MAPRRGKAAKEFSRYHTLAIETAVAVIAPLLLGRWLDKQTGKDPWFTIAGMVLGAAAAFRSVQRAVYASRKDQEKSDESSTQEPEEHNSST